jgi:signal transduction histidine kinase
MRRALEQLARIFGTAEASRVETSLGDLETRMRGDPALLADALLHVIRAAAAAARGGVRVSLVPRGQGWSSIDVAVAGDETAAAVGSTTGGSASSISDGAGLSSAKRIAEAHGGRVEVRIGRGATTYSLVLRCDR